MPTVGNDTRIEKLEIKSAFLEQELVETQQFLKDILDSSSSVSIMSTDIDSKIVFWNSGAEKLFGYTAAEVVGKKSADLLYVVDHEDSRKAIEAARTYILAYKKGTTCDVLERTKDGREIWVKLNLTPRFDEQGNIIGLLGMGQDITGHKQTESMLNHSVKKLRRAISSTVQAISSTVEMRDPYTAGHQRRATDLARAIGEDMRLSKDKIEGVRMACQIHDMGKIYVPAEILNKPGKLTKAEFALIKSHPEVGYDIIKYIDFPWPIGQIMLQHHERLDGTGYPFGLKGDKICIEARIIAVADVVESMMSHRPYRPALTFEAAMTEISQGKGIIYDEKVVDSCIHLFQNKGYVLQNKDDHPLLA